MADSPSLVAKRFALRVQPVPCIILEYAQGGKSRVRTIKLMELSSDADVDRLASKVLASLPRRLDRSGVRVQVRDMVADLLRLHGEAQQLAAADAGAAARAPAAAAAAGGARRPGPLSSDIELTDEADTDLNIVSPTRLSQAKEQMDVAFERNRKRPGEEGFVYDVRRDFAPPTEASEWDD